MESHPQRFIGALATDVLIGRVEERNAIRHAASAEVGQDFQLIASVAAGGLGKTRLLREAYRKLGGGEDIQYRAAHVRPGQEAEWQREAVICLPLIDLADPTLHAQVAFLSEVRRRLGDVLPAKDKEIFADFDTTLEPV